MNLIASLSKPAIQFVVVMILAQFFPSDIPQDTRDDFTAQTSPTIEFQMFNDDFSSMELDKILDWLHEDFGLVKDGVLLTYDEAVESFRDEYSGVGSSDVKAMNLVYNFGNFSGANHFQADCWVEWQTEIDGVESWLRFHHQFVFKIVDLKWYLVQSEFIPEDANLNYDYTYDSGAGVSQWASPYQTNVSGTSLMGIGAWPLLIGTNYANETTIHPLEGHMFNDSRWTLNAAVAAGKPTVMYFMSIQTLMVEHTDIFDAQMEFLAGLYEEFGLEDLYIFAVSDELKERFEMLAADDHDNYVPLIDETSELHVTLNISHHPYIVIFDAHGTVVGLTKTWHPENLDLINRQIFDVVAASKAD